MTKITKSKFKISRRLGVNLWGKAKDPFLSRNYPPGQHGPTLSRKPSDYGNQLRAKQKLKGYYGNISERQFRKVYYKALRMKGDTSENLVSLLERRLDAFVYRMNLANSIFGARQLVGHKHVKVNGKAVNIPSYTLKVGDVVTVTQKAESNAHVMEAIQKMERTIPSYIEFNAKAMEGKLTRLPMIAEVPYPVIMEPNLVIEFYSR